MTSTGTTSSENEDSTTDKAQEAWEKHPLSNNPCFRLATPEEREQDGTTILTTIGDPSWVKNPRK